MKARKPLTIELECPQCCSTDNYASREYAVCGDCGYRFDGYDDPKQAIREELKMERLFDRE